MVPLTQVHICSLGPVGAGHVLEDGVQNLLLDLSDGVTVEDLHWDLWAVGVVWVDTAQDLGERERSTWEGQQEELGGSLQHPGPLYPPALPLQAGPERAGESPTQLSPTVFPPSPLPFWSYKQQEGAVTSGSLQE